MERHNLNIKNFFVNINKMEEDAALIITQIRAIHNSKFVEKLEELTHKEMSKIKDLFFEVIN